MSTFGLQIYKADGGLRVGLTGTIGRIIYSGFVNQTGSVNCAPYQGVNPAAEKYAVGITIPYTSSGYSGEGSDVYWTSSTYANWSFSNGTGIMYVIIVGYA